MIIESNPFLRNDYYPDQNDIDDLNTRINEVQSDVDLLAISVNEKAEAVNGRLNNLQNDYNESFATESLNANTANINVLNVNVQATIRDLNAENTYIENLIVNKPVQDLSLRTPHLENTTSLNGNFYAPNIIGGVLDNIQVGNMQNIKAANVETDEIKANIANLNVLNAMNIEADEVTANTVNLNAVTANTADFNVLSVVNIRAEEVLANIVNFNVLNAANIEADEVKANKLIGDFFSAKPIPSSAVVGYDENGQLIPIKASYDVSFPENADYLKTDAQGIARKGTPESEVVQSTNLIQAGAVQNMYDAVNANFNNVESNVKTINDFILNCIYLPSYGSFNSSSPVNYTNATTVKLYGDAQGGTAIPGGGGMIKFDDLTNTVTFGFSSACKCITNAVSMFMRCSSLNQNILIPNLVENARSMFMQCSSLNQNILIPNLVKDTVSMFDTCTNLNQNILIPNSVENVRGMFDTCTNLNQNILIPNSVKDTGSMFDKCTKFDQNILIPNSVKDTSSMFMQCSSLNQDILIPNSVENTRNMFAFCTNLNQNILIPNSVTHATNMFLQCSNLNQNILIPNSVKDTVGLFMQCPKFNQSILIPNSVTHARSMFMQCSSLNQDIYIYSQVLKDMTDMFKLTQVNKHNVHIPSSVPKDTSNSIYNYLVNGRTGVTFAPENIINDLPVDPEQWPPV